MRDIDHYFSFLVDPYSDNEDRTQEDVLEEKHLDYRTDSVVNSIGDKSDFSSKLFLDEILVEMTPLQFDIFYNECIQRFISEYGMTSLEMFKGDGIEKTNKRRLKELIVFLEEGNDIEVIGDILISSGIEFISGDMIPELKRNIDIILNSIKIRRDRLPYFMKNFILSSQYESVIYLLIKIMNRYKDVLNTHMLIEKEKRK